MSKRKLECPEEQQTKIRKLPNNNPWYESVHLGLLELINSGVDINEVDPEGNSMLHIAVSNEFSDVVLSLLKSGVNVNIQNKRKQTPLHLPTSDEIINALLSNNADPTIWDDQNRAPVHLNSTSVPIRSKLSAQTIPVNFRDGSGWTPVHYFTRDQEYVTKKCDLGLYESLLTNDKWSPKQLTYCYGYSYRNFSPSIVPFPQELECYPKLKTIRELLGNCLEHSSPTQDLNMTILDMVQNKHTLSQAGVEYLLELCLDGLWLVNAFSTDSAAALLHSLRYFKENLKFVLLALTRLTDYPIILWSDVLTELQESKLLEDLLGLLVTSQDSIVEEAYVLQRCVQRLFGKLKFSSNASILNTAVFNFIDANVSHENWAHRRAAVFALEIFSSAINQSHTEKFVHLLNDVEMIVEYQAVRTILIVCEHISNNSEERTFIMSHAAKPICEAILKRLFDDQPEQLKEDKLSVLKVLCSIDELHISEEVLSKFVCELRNRISELSPNICSSSVAVWCLLSHIAVAPEQEVEIVNFFIEKFQESTITNAFATLQNCTSILTHLADTESLCSSSEKLMESINKNLAARRWFKELLYLLLVIPEEFLTPQNSTVLEECLPELMNLLERDFSEVEDVLLPRVDLMDFLSKWSCLFDEQLVCRKFLEWYDDCDTGERKVAISFVSAYREFMMPLMDKILFSPARCSLADGLDVIMQFVEETTDPRELYSYVPHLVAYEDSADRGHTLQLLALLVSKLGSVLMPLLYHNRIVSGTAGKNKITLLGKLMQEHRVPVNWKSGQFSNCNFPKYPDSDTHWIVWTVKAKKCFLLSNKLVKLIKKAPSALIVHLSEFTSDLIAPLVDLLGHNLVKLEALHLITRPDEFLANPEELHQLAKVLSKLDYLKILRIERILPSLIETFVAETAPGCSLFRLEVIFDNVQWDPQNYMTGNATLASLGPRYQMSMQSLAERILCKQSKTAKRVNHFDCSNSS